MNANIFDELRAALHSIWHRRMVALGVAWAVCLLGWVAVAMVPNSYESRARMLVQTDDVLSDKMGLAVSDRKQDVERIQQTLTSAVNLEKVIRATRLGEGINSPKDMESEVLWLGKRIKVVSPQDNLFEITAGLNSGNYSDAENARLAQEVVQKLIDRFKETSLAGNRGEMNQSLDFMNQQLNDRQKELQAIEQKKLALESQNPALAAGGVGAMQRVEAARAEMRGIDADLAAAQSALAAINGQLAGTPQSLPGAGPTGGARSALAQAQGELASMRARGLTDNHPDVIAAKNQVAALRAAAASDVGGGGMPNPAYSSLQSIKAERQANVQALTARRAAVQNDLAQATAQQFSDPNMASEYQNVLRDYSVLKDQYDKLLQDREKLKLGTVVETERSGFKINVIDPPTSPRAPVAPNRPVLLAGVLFLGILLGAAVAFAVGHLRSTFATTAKLERAIGLPVLGAITRTVTDQGRAIRAKHLKYFYAGCAGLGGLFMLLLVAEFIQRGMVA